MAAPNQPPSYEVPVNKNGGNTTTVWYRWFHSLAGGLTVTITTTKLTGGGANGSMTFTNGILTKSTPAT